MSSNDVAGGRATGVTEPVRELAAHVAGLPLAGRVTSRVLEEVWAQDDDPLLRDALGRSIEANVAAVLLAVTGTRDAVGAPQEALDLADACAQLDVPVSQVEKCYRVGMAAVWTSWHDAARAHAGPEAFEELIREPTLAIHRYVNEVVEAVVARHRHVHAERAQTGRHRRLLALRRFLAGETSEPPADLALDHPLAGSHLAILLETGSPSPPQAEIAELRRAAQARSAILLPHARGSWTLFLARPGSFDRLLLQRVRAALSRMDLRAAVGDPMPGPAGMRATRDQALEAARLRPALAGAAAHGVWHRDVRLEALLLRDPPGARAFVAAELGRLADGGPAGARLRQTVLAWLEAGSHLGAAAALGVHQNTVRKRLRAAEELLEGPVAGRRTELKVALRLDRLLRAAGDEPPPAGPALGASVPG